MFRVTLPITITCSVKCGFSNSHNNNEEEHRQIKFKISYLKENAVVE